MEAKISGVTIRNMKHNGGVYPKGAKVSFPPEEFRTLEGLGFVEATVPEAEKPKAKPA